MEAHPTTEVRSVRAFISYSHKDSELLGQLHEHLAALRRQRLLETWTDHEIPPGGVIDDHVDAEVEAADLYILLVSSAFIDSNYCMEKEFARALERHAAGRAWIVPVIIRECDWQIPKLKQFKALPRDGRAVISRHWHSPDEAFSNIAEGLRHLIENPPRAKPLKPPKRAETKKAEDFQPDERHITQEQRATLNKLCAEVVERLTARTAKSDDQKAKKAVGRWFGIVWSQFHEHFGTTEHKLPSLLRDQFEDAQQWFRQYRASKDKNLKRADPQKYRNTLTTAIYAIAGGLGWSKPQLYAFAAEKVGYGAAVESLNDLGNQQLEAVKQGIRYENTKRKARVGQAKARRNGKPASAPLALSQLNVSHRRAPSSTGDLHTYWLDVSFTNESPVRQEGYTLELLFPAPISVEAQQPECEVHGDILTVEGAPYKHITVKSSDPIFRGQTIQIIDQVRHPLSYQMNHDLYHAAHGKAWLFRWAFFAGNLPPMNGAIPWDQMHEF